jgi:FixJ family two-component response regulator
VSISFFISDMQMPGMSGIHMQRQFKRRAAPPPLLFMTAFSSDQLTEQARTAGAVGLLEKPINIDALIGFLDRVAPT